MSALLDDVDLDRELHDGSAAAHGLQAEEEEEQQRPSKQARIDHTDDDDGREATADAATVTQTQTQTQPPHAPVGSSAAVAPASSASAPPVAAAPVAPSALARAAHISLAPLLSSSSFEYVEPSSINVFLQCGLCTRPLYKPLEHTACRMPYCSACLEREADGALRTCPECLTAVRVGKDTNAPTKIVQLQLDALQCRCTSCAAIVTRGEFEAHWRDSCPVPCPFAAAPAQAQAEGDAAASASGCTVRLPRSQLNAHIDSCAFAPVQCEALHYGCTWQGQREVQRLHSASCPYVACLPAFARLSAQVSALRDESGKLRIALQTREGQLRSYRDRFDQSGYWSVGTVLDALDTEQQWMLAKIIKVDSARKWYRITYLDWDSSWDENIAFNSTRLAPAGTHTSDADVDKHTEKALTGTLCGNTSQAQAATQAHAVASSPSHTRTAGAATTAPAAAAASGSKRKK